MLVGGYLDTNATPGNALTLQFQFVDDALGKFRRNSGATDSTTRPW